MSEGDPKGTEPRHLFVGGCPRSGTTAMVRLLNAHPKVIVGRERFKKIVADVRPEHFAPEHFFHPPESEASFRNDDFYAKLRKRWDSQCVRYIGDKVPRYGRVLPALRDRFPDCRLVVVLRELEPVASSYNRRARNPSDHGWPEERGYRYAVDDWNESLRVLVRYVERHGDDDIFPVVHEQLYSGDRDCLDALFAFLDLAPGPKVRGRFRKMTAAWAERAARPVELEPYERDYIESHGDAGLRERAWELATEALERWRPEGAPD